MVNSPAYVVRLELRPYNWRLGKIGHYLLVDLICVYPRSDWGYYHLVIEPFGLSMDTL